MEVGIDVNGGCAGATQIAVGSVVQALVAGVGVDGGHETAARCRSSSLSDLGQRCEAVGGAGSVGNDVRAWLGRNQSSFTPMTKVAVDVLCGSGDDDLLGASVRGGPWQLQPSVKKPVDSTTTSTLMLAPLQVGSGSRSASDLDLLAVNGDAPRRRTATSAVEATEDGVVLEQVGQGLDCRSGR